MDPTNPDLRVLASLDQALAVIDRHIERVKGVHDDGRASPDLVIETVDALAGLARRWATNAVDNHDRARVCRVALEAAVARNQTLTADVTLLTDENARLTQALRHMVAETDRLQAELARR